MRLDQSVDDISIYFTSQYMKIKISLEGVIFYLLWMV